jgi:hypothetical protein
LDRYATKGASRNIDEFGIDDEFGHILSDDLNIDDDTDSEAPLFQSRGGSSYSPIRNHQKDGLIDSKNGY